MYVLSFRACVCACAHRAVGLTDCACQKLGGEAWLLKLRGQPYQQVQDELLKFTGVGRKVADCVAVFSLDQIGAVPVDTHVGHGVESGLGVDHPATGHHRLPPPYAVGLRAIVGHAVRRAAAATLISQQGPCEARA